MFGKFLTKRTGSLSVSALSAARVPSRPIIAAFSSESTGSANKDKNGAKSAPKMDLWQKIKTGVTTKSDGKGSNQNRDRKPTGKDNEKKQDFQKGPREPRAPRAVSDKKPTTSGEAKSNNGNNKPRDNSTASDKKPTRSKPKNQKSANPRPQFRPRRPQGSGPDGSSSAPSTGPRRFSRRREKDSEKSSSDRPRTVDIPEIDAALLFDDEYFVEKVRKSGINWAVQDDDADFMDHLLSTAYLESIHSTDHAYREIIASPLHSTKFHLPRTRSLHQLRCALVPKVNAPHDSYGYESAVLAWNVLQHNYYYSDREKKQLVDDIAHTANELIALTENPEEMARWDLEDDEDQGQLHEDAEKLLRQQAIAEAERRAREFAADQDAWDSDAVVDEDDIEAAEAGKN